MQRALSYANSPAQGVPLRFLLTAPWFGALAALVLMAYGESALDSRWSAALLAATHLLTLGFLSMAMAGSMLQLIPVVAGHQLSMPKPAATLCWLGLACGALLLASAFIAAKTSLFLLASGTLLAAFAALILAVGGALLRPAPPASLPMVAGMRLALPGLALTGAIGAALAATLAGAASLPLLLATELHVSWGLLGWVLMLVVCVSFQVIPMFQASPAYPPLVAKGAPLLLATLLLAWTALRLLFPPAASAMAVALALFLAGFAWLSLLLLSRRKKKAADVTTLYWHLSLSCLCACPCIYVLVPDSSVKPVLIGLLFLLGFGAGAVNGMLYKIVPFLLWYHLQLDPRAMKGEVPSIRALLPDTRARRQFWWHAFSLLALLASLCWPKLLVRPAAALLTYAFVRLALDLHGAARQCRAIQHRFQPS